MKLTLPISDRARKYGYILWAKKTEKQVADFLGDREEVEIYFNDTFIGSKKVDWKYRRISIGYSRTRNLSLNLKKFLLKLEDKGRLKVSCQ